MLSLSFLLYGDKTN
uniref:Uncharacterized protein n=1 Tax=Rhizophora mucronata TaxID=61149 RepID=A0A2P2PNX4_RHIMU